MQKLKLFLLLLLFFCCFLVASSTAVKPLFVNDNIHRTLDASTHILHETRIIAILPAKDQNLQPGTEYYLTVELMGNSSVASVVAIHDSTSLTCEHVPDLSQGIDSTGRKIEFWKVKLQKPMERTKLEIDIYYTRAVSSFPREIAQNERHLVELFGNVYMSSPYPTKKQKLKVILSSTSIQTFSNSPEPVAKNGKNLNYGPYETEVPPFAYEPLHVHFENNSPFLTVTSLQRELWLSHWGNNLAIEEWYAVENSAAKLKGQFSRIDFSHSMMNHGKTAVIKNFNIELPAGVSDPYYRDDLGNVSTSNFKLSLSKSSLDLRPRFPLYGGWVYTWYHGYNLRLSDYLKQIGGGFVFEIPFVQSIDNAPIEDFTFKVILPEGAINVKVDVPFAIDSQEFLTTFTYVDTIGKTTLLIKKKNVVPAVHSSPIKVSYDYPFSNYFRKPVVLSLAYFLIFALSMIYWRTNISYSLVGQEGVEKFKSS